MNKNTLIEEIQVRAQRILNPDQGRDLNYLIREASNILLLIRKADAAEVEENSKLCLNTIDEVFLASLHARARVAVAEMEKAVTGNNPILYRHAQETLGEWFEGTPITPDSARGFYFIACDFCVDGLEPILQSKIYSRARKNKSSMAAIWLAATSLAKKSEGDYKVLDLIVRDYTTKPWEAR